LQSNNESCAACLLEILQHVYASIWAHSGDEEQVFFYFDSENMVIYPSERGGFDKVYARIHISNLTGSHGCFFKSFTIKSLKKKNAVLVAPKSLKGFIEDLKVLVDLNYDAAFRLTQSADAEDGVKKQYIEVTGTQTEHLGNTFKSYIEVSCHFSEQQYPEELDQKEVDFQIDSTTCSMFLAKFANRFSILSDEVASINFLSAGVGERRYALQMNSQHMSSQVTNKHFEGRMRDQTNEQNEYVTSMKKEVFLKFFSILKQPGYALFRVSHNAKLEMAFTWEKSSSI